MSPRARPRRPPVAGSAVAPRRRVRAWAAGLAVAAVLLALGVVVARRREGGPSLPRTRLSLLLITLDTMRADRLGCYGYSGARTRYLDGLAAEGVRFEQAISPSPITLPAHASILTGLYPIAHGVRNNGNFYLSDRFETLATVLKARSYRTAAFISSFILDRRYGLARGFDTYDDRMEGAQTQIVSLEAERRGDRTALALSRWLESQASAPGPFFAWLHLYDPHEPYRPPQPFRDMFKDAPYDGEIAFDDAVVASILDKLEQLGLRDRTLIAAIGDHGEGLGDHGEETHSMFVYESAIRVPLILWRPGTLPAGRVVREPVRATDLAPTLLDLLGAPPLKTEHGRSLVSLIEGRAAGRLPAAYAETYLPQFYMNWAPLRALRDERYKLIDAPRPELYDLQADPQEARNLYESRAETARALRLELQRLTGGHEGEMSAGALDREAAEKLAALGYIGAGATPPAAEAARKDPKDVIQVFNRLRRANSAVRDRRFDEALPILKDVLTEDPNNAFARLVTGSAHMGMGQYPEAIRWFRRYLELVPTSAYAHQWIAICYVRLQKGDDALREAAAALAIDPRFSDARLLRGGVLASRGAYDAAIAELRTAVATDPAKFMLRLDLAKVLSEAGRAADAQTEYEAILKLKPDDLSALTGLAVLRAKGGALEEAVSGLRHVLALDPRQAEARFNLAEVLKREGRAAEAEAEYRRVAEDPEVSAPLRESARRALTPPDR